jgi:hypothetical protein
MTAPALAAIHAGTIRAYVVAHITYVDWDNGTHWTTCCYRYNADLKHLTVYKNYNDMDR